MREVWEALGPLSQERGIDPGFVYALVKLESDFDAQAQRGDARGLLQLKPRAWTSASQVAYAVGVFNWRENLKVGVDVLAGDKARLEAKGVFSYPLLWAVHAYGWDYVAARGFDIGRAPRPSNPLALRLYSGDAHPLEPPR